METIVANKKMSAQRATDKQISNTTILTSDSANCNVISKRLDDGMAIFCWITIIFSVLYFGWQFVRWMP